MAENVNGSNVIPSNQQSVSTGGVVPANLHNNPDMLLGLLQQLTDMSDGDNGNDYQFAQAAATPRSRVESVVSRASSGAVAVKSQNSTPIQTMNEMQGLPDQGEILERLSKIREHKRQVLDMMDKLKKNGEEVLDKDMLRKLINAYDNFKQQEEQYLGVLQKILTLKQSFTTAAMEESGFQSDVPSESSDNFFQVMKPADVVNGNGRPMIEDKVGFMLEQMENRIGVRVNSNANGDEDEYDELTALTEQRDMLKKMLRQQEELRALQGRHAAQQGQRVNESPTQRPQTTTREKEYMATRQQIDDQAASLASKRKELEDLKATLETVRGLYGENTSQAEIVQQHEEVDVPRQLELEDKLRLLKNKKIHMDDILSQLSNFHSQAATSGEFLNASVANLIRDNPQQQHVQNVQRPAVENNAPMPVDNRVILQQKYQELLATKKRIADVKKLMAQLEEESDRMESSPTTPINQQPQQQQQQYQQRQQQPQQPQHQQRPLSFVDNAPPNMNQQMKSAYESKINEQQQAIISLQGEHERLLGIKNQLMSLNDDQLRQIGNSVDRTASVTTTNEPQSSVLRTNDEVWRELRAQAIQREENATTRQQQQSRSVQQQNQLLNNTKDNLSDYSFASRSRNLRGSVAATYGDDEFDENAVYRNNNSMNVNSNNNLDSDGIVSNPLLASFRRNNDIQDNHSPIRNHQTSSSSVQQRSSNTAVAAAASVTPSTQNKMSEPNRERERRRLEVSSTPLVGGGGSSMDDELQQHIDSIRTIFETLMKERNGGVAAAGSAPTTSLNEFQTPTNLLQSLLAATSMGPSTTFAVQQQQLTISLLSCQQQLQLQQMEMRYLQQLCHDLMNFHQLQRTPMSDPPTDMIQSQTAGGAAIQQQPARSRSASFAQVTGNHPVAAVVPPLDGRPLSSASLYNLLAPNPYLTFPYYPLPQMQQNFMSTQSPKNVLNNSFLMNNAATGSLGRGFNKSPMTHGASAPPPPTANSQNFHHQRHQSAMEQSNFSDCSDRSMTHHHHGKSIAASSANESPSKFTRPPAVGGIPKLDLDSLCKSNVAKKQKNFDNVVQQMSTNDVADASMSRVSSVASAIANGAYGQDGNYNGDQFDALREMIYSEVATLISQNEQRPHYLLELFRELQLLSSDHLRSRALHAIREVLNRFLTDDTDGNETEFEYRGTASGNPNPTRTVVEETQTDSAWTSDDEAFKQKRTFVPVSSRDKAHDFSETACSGSTVSTPDQSHAFGVSDGLSQTVIQYEKPQTVRTKRFENLEDIKDVKNAPLNNSTATKKSTPSTTMGERSDILANKNSNVDVAGLERDIQAIVDELIPFLRDNADSLCTPQLLQYLRKFILTLTNAKCHSPSTNVAGDDAISASTPAINEGRFFNRTLSSILDEALSKFKGFKLQDCCEEVVSDISEVIFNELAFYRLMQNIDATIDDGQRRFGENFDKPDSDRSAAEKTSNLISSAADGKSTTNSNVSFSVFEHDFPHIDDDVSQNALNADGEKSKGDDTSSAGHFLTRTPSDSRETTPYEELREVEDTLDFIDDEFQTSTARESGVLRQDTVDEPFHDAYESRAADELDIDRDEMSVATDSIRNVPVVHQNGPTTNNLAQLCDAE